MVNISCPCRPAGEGWPRPGAFLQGSSVWLCGRSWGVPGGILVCSQPNRAVRPGASMLEPGPGRRSQAASAALLSSRACFSLMESPTFGVLFCGAFITDCLVSDPANFLDICAGSTPSLWSQDQKTPWTRHCECPALPGPDPLPPPGLHPFWAPGRLSGLPALQPGPSPSPGEADSRVSAQTSAGGGLLFSSVSLRTMQKVNRAAWLISGLTTGPH